MKKMLLLLAGMFCAAAVSGAPLVITKGTTENPRLVFSGISGNAELSREVASLLRASGWFDMVKSDGMYTLSGTAAGAEAQLKLEMGGVPMVNFRVKFAGDVREAAKTAVDAVLEYTFKDLKIKGFCHTKIAFCAESSRGIRNIYMCDIDGKDVRQITFFKSLCVEPAWFNNGASIGYTKYGRGSSDIIETKLSPLMSRRLTSLDGLNVGVAFDEKHNRIAIISSSAGDHFVDLYIRELVPGSRMKRLTRSRAVEASPCFSPDGKKICYVSDQGGRPRLYVIPAEGGKQLRLPCVGSEAYTPDWSPDGEKIIYVTRTSRGYSLAMYDLKSGENKLIGEAAGVWESPSWAADNRHVVCKRSNGSRSRLFIVDTRTGKMRELLTSAGNLSMPAWSKARSR